MMMMMMVMMMGDDSTERWLELKSGEQKRRWGDGDEER